MGVVVKEVEVAVGEEVWRCEKETSSSPADNITAGTTSAPHISAAIVCQDELRSHFYISEEEARQSKRF